MKIVQTLASKEFGEFLQNSTTCNTIYLDTETSGLDPYSSKLYTVQIMFDDTEATYIFDMLSFDNLPYLIGLIEKKLVVGHNIGFDLKMLKHNSGIMLKDVYCTQVNHVLINQGLLNSQYPSLEELVYEYCGIELDKEVRKKFYEFGELKSLTQEMLIYSAEDVKYLKEIRRIQIEKLKESKQLNTSSLESLITPVIAQMELDGIIIEKEAWLKLSDRASKEAEELGLAFKSTVIELVMSKKKFSNALELIEYLRVTEVKTKRDRKAYSEIAEKSFMKEIAMKHFNPASTAQAFNLINNILKVKIKNTNEKTLNKVYDKDPLIKQLVDFRVVSKSASTYGEEFLEHINSVTGKVHSSFNQVGAQTGRLSSEKPNVQNIPAESDYRDCFVADEGYKFICADYSQQELRVLAVLCRDRNLIKAFIDDLDIHQNTASHLFDKPYDEVTKKERNIGKSLNFGVVYGISAFGLLRNWGIPMEEGKKYLYDFYHKAYPEFGAFKEKIGDMLYNLGYSNTLLGRKRYYAKKTLYKDPNEMWYEKESIIRKGVNHLVQGTSGDMMKMAMADIYYKNPFGEKNLKLLLQVHDEVLVMVKEDIAEEAKDFVADCLLRREVEILDGVVPPKIDIKIADYWAH